MAGITINPDMLDPEKVNPIVAWEAAWTKRAIWLVIVTVVFIGITIALLALGNTKEVESNISRYRCNPMMMPFISYFGYDTQENFQFCLNSMFDSKASEIFTPIYTLLASFTQVIKLVVDVALGIRKLFSNFLLGMNSFIQGVRDRIQTLLFQLRLSFIKMQNLMGRVYGTMNAVVFMGTSALLAGFNIADNSLVKFLFEFCFHPDTPIKMHDGSWKPIRNIKIGDKLALNDSSTTVTSCYQFTGSNTPMVSIHGIQVSEQHFIQYQSKWIKACEHPDATRSESLPILYCLSVDSHQFIVSNEDHSILLTVADYDEHSDTDVVKQTQLTALKALNGSSTESECTHDYSLGLDEDICIRMNDKSWKRLRDVQLGDEILYSGSVLGKVSELCNTTIELDGYNIAPGQLLHNGSYWVRAANYGISYNSNKILQSIITSKCNTFIVMTQDGKEYAVRDYREVANPDMESAYEAKFVCSH